MTAKPGDRPLAVALAWIERHLAVPDGPRRGEPLRLYGSQVRFLGGHYLVRSDARPDQDGPAFRHRRSVKVGPQKLYKSPLAAMICALEGVGPALFVGFAAGDEVYACREHGCPCGWVWRYAPGEPMGRHWHTPLIQITAVAEDATDKVYDALRPMIALGRLSAVIPQTREEFIRLPRGGRIDVVTASADARLGDRVTAYAQDETGIWTAQNKMVKLAERQRNGCSAMGGRGVELTNPPDPTEDSVAQRSIESGLDDVLVDWVQAPKRLSYRNARDRRRIHEIVYEDATRDKGGHVDLDSIDAEAAERVLTNPAQAERFYGSRMVRTGSTWMPDGRWDASQRDRRVRDGTTIVLGADGSDVDDWTGIRAETLSGYQFTPLVGPDETPAYWDPATTGGRIPRGEVLAAFDELHVRYRVVRVAFDPYLWDTEIAELQRRHGSHVRVWPTNHYTAMHRELERFLVDLTTAALTHDSCPQTALHVARARKVPVPGQKYVLGKPLGAQSEKIDLAVCSVLAHVARADALAAGISDEPEKATTRPLVFGLT